jgi:hypothetical protein
VPRLAPCPQPPQGILLADGGGGSWEDGLLACFEPLIARALMPVAAHRAGGFRSKALVRAALRCLAALQRLLPVGLWSHAWAAVGGTFWLSRCGASAGAFRCQARQQHLLSACSARCVPDPTALCAWRLESLQPPASLPGRLSRDKEAGIRRAAICLLANLLAPGAEPTQRMLAAGWPDCGARLLRVAADAFECHGVRAAALAFAAAAAAVDPLTLDAWPPAAAAAAADAGGQAGSDAEPRQGRGEAEGQPDADEERRAAAAPGALRRLQRLGLAALLQQQPFWEALPPLLAAAATGGTPPALAAAAATLAAQALGADPSGVGARLLAGEPGWEGPQPLITRALASALPRDAPAPAPGGCGGGEGADVPGALLAVVTAGAAAQSGAAGLPSACAAQARVLEWLPAAG